MTKKVYVMRQLLWTTVMLAVYCPNTAGMGLYLAHCMCLLLPDSRFGVRQHCHSDKCYRLQVVQRCPMFTPMADSPQSVNPRNPNWGGRREGSGRKKRTFPSAALPGPPIPQVDSTTPPTTQTRHPVNASVAMSSGPTRGFFAPRSHTRFPHTLHPNAVTNDTNRVGTDGQQGGLGVDREENGTLYCTHCCIPEILTTSLSRFWRDPFDCGLCATSKRDHLYPGT